MYIRLSGYIRPPNKRNIPEGDFFRQVPGVRNYPSNSSRSDELPGDTPVRTSMLRG